MKSNRLSFVASATAAFIVSTVHFSPSNAEPVAPAAADQALGMAIMSAVVRSDGVLVRPTGAVSSSRVTTGFYDVFFERNVQSCTFYATSGGENFISISYSALVSTAYSYNYANAVRVTTQRTTDAAFFDATFHLLVFCPR